MPVFQLPPQENRNRKSGLLRVTTPEGGRFWTDGRLMALLEFSQGKTYDEILKTFPTHMGSIKSVGAALDCLARAGFIEQTEQQPFSAEGPPITGPLVSAIMVGFNSRRWLEVSLPTLLDQTYSPLEIILVDNNSEDGTAAWLNRHYPSLQFLPLSPSQPLARALNQGIRPGEGGLLPPAQPGHNPRKRGRGRNGGRSRERRPMRRRRRETQTVPGAGISERSGQLCGPVFLGNRLGIGAPGFRSVR